MSTIYKKMSTKMLQENVKTKHCVCNVLLPDTGELKINDTIRFLAGNDFTVWKQIRIQFIVLLRKSIFIENYSEFENTHTAIEKWVLTLVNLKKLVLVLQVLRYTLSFVCKVQVAILEISRYRVPSLLKIVKIGP